MSDYDGNGEEYVSLRNRVGDRGGGSSPYDAFDDRDSHRKVFLFHLYVKTVC